MDESTYYTTTTTSSSADAGVFLALFGFLCIIFGNILCRLLCILRHDFQKSWCSCLESMGAYL
mgnify:CR=1 FL=1